jgi:acyl dehydratase
MRFADFIPGKVLRAGPREVSEEEIIEFARRYDPQPFHIDPRAASSSRWGGLISSGWLTCCIAMELAVRSVLDGSESIGSPGIDELRWEKPVRPGDRLELCMTVLESRISSSATTGIVRWRWEVSNQSGARVLALLATSFVEVPGIPPAREAQRG